MNTIRRQPSKLDLPEPLSKLEDIAYNLWWSWQPAAQNLFQEINPQQWQVAHNPIALLLDTPAERWQALAADGDFLQRLQQVHASLIADLAKDSSLGVTGSEADSHLVAYLCTEFGLHESLPIYSGGLGVLAGDHTKSASDLGVPFVGVGLLYKNGYFRQEIDAEGNQHAVFQAHDFTRLPIKKVMTQNDQPVRVRIGLPGRDVFAQAWLVQVGKSMVLLLDTDIDENGEADRGITAQLYGGDRKMRIQQEIVLGIGAVRLLRTLGLKPAAWHLNEGHVAFSALERIKEHMQEHGLSFADASEAVRATTAFTTHTPVPAGNEAFSIPLIDRYFRHYCESFGLNVANFIRLGLQNREDGEKFFSMTVLALRLSCVSNGVSALHGAVSKSMWAHLWPDIPERENPITSITNGVHTLTWMAPKMAEFLTKMLGDEWQHRIADSGFWQAFEHADSEQLQASKKAMKAELIAFVRQRLRMQYQRHGASQEKLEALENWLDPEVLTIGFARRFATYKRALLIFKDIERIKNIINHPQRPVQLLFAGKAHPADERGQALIREIWRLSQMPEFAGKIILLENYDMRMGRALVQGVDVWLNNPRRPQEASGTSGQKVPINGGINFSVLDGWWPEAFRGDNGWTIGRDEDYANHEAQDHEDAYSLYDTLENFIIPLYYGEHSSEGKAWPDFMKASLRTILPAFNTEMMVRNYFEKMYKIAIDNAEKIKHEPQLVSSRTERKQTYEANWPLIHFTEVDAKIDRDSSFVEVSAALYLGELRADDVTVELYCEHNGEPPVRTFVLENTGEREATIKQYALAVATECNSDARYRLRVVPSSDAFVHWNELGLICWKDLV